MSPQLSPQWQLLAASQARIRTIQFNTNTLVFLQFHGSQRIASYVSAKLERDSVAQDDGDVNVQVHFGNRDDLWAQVIARSVIELVGTTEVLLALSSKSPQNEHDTRVLLEELKETILLQ